MAKARKADQIGRRVTEELANSLQSELNDICPEESWGGWLFGGAMKVTDVQYVPGRRGGLEVHINGRSRHGPPPKYILTLEGVIWKRAK